MTTRIPLLAIRASLIIVMSLVVSVPLSHAQNATLTYHHLYADADGTSHMRAETLTFNAPHAGEPLMHSLDTQGPAMLIKLPTGTEEDWHNAPMKLYLLIVQGIAEVSTSDGKTHTFKTGDIVLMDDLTGKGHKTRAVGKVDHVALGLAAAAPATQQPAAKP